MRIFDGFLHHADQFLMNNEACAIKTYNRFLIIDNIWQWIIHGFAKLILVIEVSVAAPFWYGYSNQNKQFWFRNSAHRTYLLFLIACRQELISYQFSQQSIYHPKARLFYVCLPILKPAMSWRWSPVQWYWATILPRSWNTGEKILASSRQTLQERWILRRQSWAIMKRAEGRLQASIS